MPLINYDVELILDCFASCVIINAIVVNQVSKFEIAESLYVPEVTLSTQDNVKLLSQLKSGFKRRISWKYLTKPELLS